MRVDLYHPALDVTLSFHERTVAHYRHNGWIFPSELEEHPDHRESPDPGEDETELLEN